MSTKLQYPINQTLREAPLRSQKSGRLSKQSGQHSAIYYPEINTQKPIHPEESQTQSNGSYPRKDREYRMVQDHSEQSRHFNGRGSTESLHEIPNRSKRNDTENDNHALPELGKKTHSSPSSPVADSAQSLTHHTSPTSVASEVNKQQLQLRTRPHRDIPAPRGHPSDSDIDGRVEIGLENLGNTCFMNSALQCLLHIQPLVDYFLHGRFEQDLNPSSPKKGMLASSFNHLIQEVVAKRSGAAIAPTNFQRAVAVFAPYLLDFQQQDSQEFLRFLLDGMSEDLCRRRVHTANNSICSPVTSSANHDPHHDKPQSSGSASTQGRLSAKSAQQHQQSILPMLPGATIEPLVTPPQRSENPHTTSTFHGLVAETTEGATLMISPRFNSVQKLRMETRAMQEATNQQQLSQQHHHQSPQHADDATGAIELSAKLRISREIGAARKVVSDDSVIGISSSNSAINNILDTNSNNNNKLNPVNFAETAPASLGSMLLTGEINPANDGRVESAPSTARVTHTPSFSRQLRDVMTGKTLRLRRDRVNSANSSNNVNGSGEDGGSGRASTHSDGGEGNSCTLTPVNVEEVAIKAWDRYLKFNDSIITDIFGGLLQSTVQCLTCQHRSYAFDPFLDLSVPIHRDGEGTNKGLFSTIRQVTSTSENRSTLEKCLEKFTSEEVLDGDNMVKCDRCNKPRKSIKQLSIFRYPKILVVHIKRFRFNNFSREKLSTDVHFPMTGLDLCGYLSHDRPKSLSNLQSNNNNEGLLTQREQQQQEELSPMPASSSPSFPHLRSPKIKASMNPNLIPPAIVTNTMVRPVSGEEPPPIYDLIGVSNHHGTLNGGHYVAHVDTEYGRSQGRSPRWMCFNDARVSLAQAAHIAGPTAYVLFYKLRDDVHIQL